MIRFPDEPVTRFFSSPGHPISSLVVAPCLSGISGEVFGCSFATVKWKRHFVITAPTTGKVRLVEQDLLLPEFLGPLVRNTIFAGHIHHSLQVESTNLLASRAAAAGRNSDKLSEGEVFLAEEQTAGRGRGNHSWYSERGAGI